MATNMQSRLTVQGFPADLNSSQDVQVVYSSLPEPDPNWTYTDQQGHKHYRKDNGYPTLVEVEDETYWCSDCRDEHTDYHYECAICGETITPGTRPPNPAGTPIAGLIHHELTVYGDAGESFESDILGEPALWERVGYYMEAGSPPKFTYVPTRLTNG